MDEWTVAHGLDGRWDRSGIPLTLMSTTLMDHSGGDGRMIYICPVCPWTVEYRTSELVASGITDCALVMEDALAAHLRDPGCNWDFRTSGTAHLPRLGDSSSDQIHRDHAAAGGPHGHAAGSVAEKVCLNRQASHDRLWKSFLDGSLEADSWWS